jgi:hypothetical protein
LERLGLKTREPEVETEETLGERIFFYALDALLFAAAGVLAFGGAPAWAETTSAAFLWSFVVFFDLLLAICIATLVLPRVRERLESLIEGRVPGTRLRQPSGRFGRIRHYALRLGQLFFLMALLVSGRLVLTGLYVLLPILVWTVQARSRRWFSGCESQSPHGRY